MSLHPTVAAANALADDLSALRRDLHEAPEIGLHLPGTQQRVLNELADIDLEITLGKGLSSVVGVLRGGAPTPVGQERPVVLLRGDMDGLPVDEEVDAPYASTNGAMHACGHDLHVAALVGATRLLDQRREELAGDVVLMFQPAEEGPGGAEVMVAEGLLDVAGRRVDAAYAMHVFSSEVPHRHWSSRPKELMAGADTVKITVHGEGGHGSTPFRCLDPVPVLCEIVLALQTMVTRRFDVFDPVLLTVGLIRGGSKDNIISDEADLAATLRTFSAHNLEVAMREIVRVVDGVSAAHGMTATVGFSEGYPATINDPDEYALGEQVVKDLFGPDRMEVREFPEMGSEDMSFVMNEVPGAYFFLGACPPEADPDTAADNHSARAVFDDMVLSDAAAWLAEMAIRRIRLGVS